MSRLPAFVNNIVLPTVCLLAGAAGAIAVCGQSSSQHALLLQRLKEYQELPGDRQNIVRRSNSDFEKQPESRRVELLRIFDAAQGDPKLKQTMEAYYAWWSSLTPDQWEHFRDLSTNERLEFVKTAWNSGAPSDDEIVVEFSSGPANLMPALHMSFAEFAGIISAAFSPTDTPEALASDLMELKSEKHRALRQALWLMNSMANSRNIIDNQSRGQALAAALQKADDGEWAARFSATLEENQGRPFLRAWRLVILVNILDQAATALGEDLRKEFPITNSQIVDAFAAIGDRDLQRSLMTMSADEAKTRLELLAKSTAGESPEQRLLAEYNRVSGNRRSLLNAPFSSGGNRSGTPDGRRGPGRSPVNRDLQRDE